MCSEIASDPLASQLDVKPVVLLYDVANNNDIINQLEDYEIIIVSDSSDSEDDMEMKIGPKGYGQPLNCIVTPEGLIKRELPDVISGDIPFIEKVKGTFSKQLNVLF